MAQLLLCRRAPPESGSCTGSSVLIARLSHDQGSALLCKSDGSLQLAPLEPGLRYPPAASTHFSVCLRCGKATEEVTRPIAAVACTPDGTLLSQRGSGKILFCPGPAAEDNTALLFLFGSCQQGSVACLATGPSGSLLACGDSSGGLAIWGTAYGALLASTRGHTSPGRVVSALCFLDDELVATGRSNGMVHIWRLSGGSLSLESEMQWGPVSCLAHWIGPSGQRLLVVGTSDGSTQLLDFQGGSWRACEVLRPAEGPPSPVTAMACSQHSSQLAIAQGGTISIHHLPSMSLLHQQQFAAGIAGCSFLQAGHLLVFLERGSSLLEIIPPVALPPPQQQQDPPTTLGMQAATAAAGAGPGRKAVRFLDGNTAGGRAASRSQVDFPGGPRGALPPLPPHPLLQLRQRREQDMGAAYTGSGMGAHSKGINTDASPDMQQQSQQEQQQQQQPGNARPALVRAAAPEAGVDALSCPPSRATEAALEFQSPIAPLDEGEQPCPCPLPHPQPQPAPGRRRCEACSVLGSHAGTPSGSPVPQQPLLQLAQDDADAVVAPEPRACGPLAPFKQGVVVCGRASQQAGQQLPQQQARVVVTVQDAGLAPMEVCSERLVRLSRRVPPQAAQGQQAGEGSGATALAAQAADGEERDAAAVREADGGVFSVGRADVVPSSEPSTSASSDAAAAEPGRRSSALACLEQGQAVLQISPQPSPMPFPANGVHSGGGSSACSSPGSSPGRTPSPKPAEITAAVVPEAQHAQGSCSGSSSSGGCSVGAIALREVNSQLSRLDFQLVRLAHSAQERGAQALASSACVGWGRELAGGVSTGMGFPGAAVRGEASAQRQQQVTVAPAAGQPQPLQHVQLQAPTAAAAGQQAGPRLQPAAWASPATAQFEAGSAAPIERPRPASASVQQHAVAASHAPAVKLSSRGDEEQPVVEPPPRLAVPQLNSSLLLLAAQMRAQPPPVAEHIQREVRIREATAATTFPPDALVLPPASTGARRGPRQAAEGAGPAGTGVASPQREQRQVAGKQLDAKWAARREVRPRLEDLWAPPALEPRFAPLPFTVEVSGRRAAQRLLGQF